MRLTPSLPPGMAAWLHLTFCVWCMAMQLFPMEARIAGRRWGLHLLPMTLVPLLCMESVVASFFSRRGGSSSSVIQHRYHHALQAVDHTVLDSVEVSASTDPRLEALEASLPRQRPQLLKWSDELLEDNGGTVLAMAGDDYCVLAADTRLSRDYLIRSRNVSRTMQVSPRTFIGMGGSWADVLALRRELAFEMSLHESRHGALGTVALATFLSNRLYLYRLKPLYAQNVVAGLDHEGRGAVFTYDVIGSFNRVAAACCGRGQELMQPVIDQLAKSGAGLDGEEGLSLTVDEAVAVVEEAFLSGAEREISIGDEVEIVVMRRDSEPSFKRLTLPKH